MNAHFDSEKLLKPYHHWKRVPHTISKRYVRKQWLRFLTLLGRQSRSGHRSLAIRLLCPGNGTAVLDGSRRQVYTCTPVFSFFNPLNEKLTLIPKS